MEPSDLGLLLTLDALLQEGSVTKAARRVGLSTPAMSHALSRIRDRLADPLLVRAGRGMVLTPRAETLRPQVQALVAEARRVLEPEQPFVPAKLQRKFVVLLTDYVLAVLGASWDRLLCEEAPHVALRMLPNTPDDAALLRDGTADLAIGIYGTLLPELRLRPLLTDRFVCAVRKDHPHIGKRLTLDEFVKLDHIQIAPRGKPGGYVDDMLHERGLSRRVARAIPYFHSALYLVAQSDYIVTVSERVANLFAEPLGLRLLPPPSPCVRMRSAWSGIRASTQIRPIVGCAKSYSGPPNRPLQIPMCMPGNTSMPAIRTAAPPAAGSPRTGVASCKA